MDEKKLLENFAKILGSSAQEELKKIEERKLKEEHIVKSFDVALSKLVTPQNDTIKEIFEKKIVINPPELKTTNKQHVLEATNLVSQAVTATNVPENGKKTETDLINSSLRKEIEVIKKNVSDFHKIIHEQSRKISLAGSSHGGGEVNLRYLDDIDRSSIRQGHFLTYDDSTKKFMFSQIAEGNVDLSHIDQQLTPGANGVYNLGSPTDYWANVYADSLILDGGGIEANGSFGNARIQSAANIDILASNSIWSFGTDSVLTTPNYGKIIFNSYGLGSPEHYIESTQGFHIHASDAVIIDVGANTYSFGNDGVFTLPEGGDIKNSSGYSVITDLLNISSDIIPYTTNTYSLGNNTLRWESLWLGGNSITFSDNFGGPDQVLSLANQVFYIAQRLGNNTSFNANAGFNAGGLILQNYSLVLAEPERDMTIGSPRDGGTILINRKLSVGSTSDNVYFFSVDSTGNTNIIGNLTINANLYANGITGNSGQALTSNGSGIYWGSVVTSITTGTGLTRTASTGDIGIDSTAVLSIIGTENQISVSNTGGNYTLTLPQNLNTNASVQFGSLTVNNFIVTGATTSAETLAISDKVLHLAYDSTTEAQIVGGGITLGNTSSSYYVSFLYDLNHNRWDTSTTGLKTSDLFSANATMANIIVSNTAHFGSAYLYDDYPNALIQVDEDLNSYAQIISQNHNAGTQASTDYVAVNNLGTDSSYYIDMGINGSNYSNTGWTISGPNDAYLYNANGNLTIGTATENKIIKFHVGGTLAENQIAQLDTTGLYVDGDITAVNYYGTLKGTANNTLYVGSVTAANVVSNSQLIANLANYQTTAGLSANVAKLTSNNTSYIGSVTAANVVSNSQLSSNLANYALLAGATFTGNVVVNANLTTNAIFTTGNSSVNTVISGSTVTTANLTSKYIIANSSSGSSKQVLMSGGNSANVYWQWTNQHFALGANLSLNATSTSAQSLFGVGVQVANNSRYAISMIGSMTYTGGGPAGGGNIGFGFGGTANLASVYYQTTTSVDNTENGGTNPQLAAFRLTSGFIANASTNQVTNFNKPYLMFNIQGVISVANGGTLIPQYDTDHASTTLTLLALSSVSLELLGDNSAANSVTGTWA